MSVIEAAGVRVLAGHTGAVNSVTFSPDGAKLATVSADLTPRLWDARTGACTHELTGHTVAVFGVAFSPDGRVLATTSYDEKIGRAHV